MAAAIRRPASLARVAAGLRGPLLTTSTGGDTSSQTHFGNRTVPKEEKAKLVGEVFSRVASRYDLMNDLMSGGVHRIWKDHFVAAAGIPAMSATGGFRALDVAGGTGDIGFRIATSIAEDRKSEAYEIVISDINGDMLKVGEQRAAARGLPTSDNVRLTFVEGDAQALPFDDASFDLYTIAFGIRNVTNIPTALQEAHRVLKPGGRFMCLEFSRVPHPLLRRVYDQYSFHLIPALGEYVANDRESYAYLVESIRKFPPQEAFADMIRDVGFRSVVYENLSAGIAAIHSGVRL